MSSDPCNIWHSKISTATKIRLYNVYILPVLLYGAETWTLTKVLSAEIDSFDQWCQRRILRLHYSQHVSNHEVRRRTDCTPASEIVQSRRLKLFGHTARADVELDHHSDTCCNTRPTTCVEEATRMTKRDMDAKNRGWSAPPEHRTTYRLAPGTGSHYLEETHEDRYALPRGMLQMMMIKKYTATFKPGLGVTQGHWRWHHSIWHPWLPINVA